ncbi:MULTISPECIES: malonate--CoA ligase [Phyllobacteriaceae]|uniref:Malonyl-CoA synthase n=1 Tax=Mesorhizobium hungaricum TaxID=1566387 RepID=A0A1C2DFD8_9HYPH|nr:MULTISPECIES: malonyl-CoA synthase [Mesorhizobium]MBN9232417.1 malonyl-CoA synthase [Mesorhizobium sp.]MDQ0330014.1 malonyl-CoA/methylmalonyl-CoA synthetase [Mesorhizobium sp. YL-MeA3-2017]OCX13437.1 malonyl-CoA synthase [Mesorhizobium hungaricum]
MANTLYDALFKPHEASEATFLRLKDGSTVSYAGFLALSARFAHAMAEAGITPGDRVALQARKSVEALAVYAAAVRMGAVFLPLNTAYTAAEVDYFVSDAGAKLLICDSASEAALRSVADKAGAVLMTLSGDGSGTLKDRAQGKPATFAPAERGPDDLAAFLYTSGTTGRSKGAMLTHDNLLSNAEALVDTWRFTKDDVLLHALPIFHTHGLFVATNVILLAGGSAVFLPGLDLDDLVANMPVATTMMGVPTFYTRLLADPRLTHELVAHMRLFVSGSAPLLAETHRDFEARTGKRILERYGMTETNMNTSNPYEGERRAGTVGQPLPGVSVRIADPDTGKPVAAGGIGVIEVKGRNVFKGYWNMPEKTAQEFRVDGYFITGDLATQDADGYVTIVGRAKDLIIAGGYNIYPKEIELLLDEIPGVEESAVVGVPHPDLGEGVVGIVTARKGTTLDEATLLAGLSTKLARFKQPRRIFVVDELPRNTMGKVQKNLLRERFAGTFKG